MCQVYGTSYGPTWQDVPLLLKHLSFHEIIALRPITIHQDQYCKPRRAGFRRHDSLTTLTWSTVSVVDQIRALDSESRFSTQVAYDFWMKSYTLTYRVFVREHQEALSHGVCGQPLWSSFLTRPYLENAHWPDIDPSVDFLRF